MSIRPTLRYAERYLVAHNVDRYRICDVLALMDWKEERENENRALADGIPASDYAALRTASLYVWLLSNESHLSAVEHVPFSVDVKDVPVGEPKFTDEDLRFLNDLKVSL